MDVHTYLLTEPQLIWAKQRCIDVRLAIAINSWPFVVSSSPINFLKKVHTVICPPVDQHVHRFLNSALHRNSKTRTCTAPPPPGFRISCRLPGTRRDGPSQHILVSICMQQGSVAPNIRSSKCTLMPFTEMCRVRYYRLRKWVACRRRADFRRQSKSANPRKPARVASNTWFTRSSRVWGELRDLISGKGDSEIPIRLWIAENSRASPRKHA